MLKKYLLIFIILPLIAIPAGCSSGPAGGVSTLPMLAKSNLYFGKVDKNVYSIDLNGKEVKKYENLGVVSASPSVADGKVFVGSDDYQTLFALDETSGKLLWQFETGGQVVTTTFYDNGIVYFASDNFYAIDADTGKELWRFDIDTPVVNPVVENGIVFFIGYTADVYALDIKTGKEKWHYRTEDVVFTELPPVIKDGKAYVGADDLVVLDGKTGKEIWRFEMEGGVLSTPQITENVIYFGSDKNKIYAVDIESKKAIWSESTGSEVLSAPAIDNTKVYFGSNQGNFYAFDAATGKKSWSVKLTDVKSKFFEKMRERTAEQTPIVKDSTIYYVMVNDGTLYAIDANGGKVKWSL